MNESEDRRVIPDRRKTAMEALDSKVEESVEEKIKKVEARLSRWLTRGLIAFSIIAAGCVAGLVGYGLLLGDLQETRKEFVFTSCKAQNERHDKTIAEFEKASKEAVKRHPELADEIKESKEANLEIIEALTPEQDCKKLSEVAVGEAEPPPPVSVPTTTRSDP